MTTVPHRRCRLKLVAPPKEAEWKTRKDDTGHDENVAQYAIQQDHEWRNELLAIKRTEAQQKLEQALQILRPGTYLFPQPDADIDALVKNGKLLPCSTIRPIPKELALHMRRNECHLNSHKLCIVLCKNAAELASNTADLASNTAESSAVPQSSTTAKTMILVYTGYGLSDDGVWRSHSWVMCHDALHETTEARIAYFGVVCSCTICTRLLPMF